MGGRGGSRGRGGGRRGIHLDQAEGSGGRGRGRSRGGGREKRQSGDTSRTGFVAGGGLVDWDATTPDRRQLNGRGGRTPEGLDAGLRYQTSSGRRGSQNREGVEIPAQNPFAFVSFDYSQLERRRPSLLERSNMPPPVEGGAAASGDREVVVPVEGGAAASVDREVVVPAIEGRVEVYMDRKGSQESFEALELETRTTGLGFEEHISAGSISHMTEAEKSGNIADSELNCIEDKNVAALEAMTVDSEEDYYLHLKASVHEKNLRSTPWSKKNRRGRGSSFEIPLMEGRNSGYLSIGGVKVFTEAGITYSDESIDLGDESDVSLELDFSSGKKRRSKGSTSKDKGSPRASGAHRRGKWLEDSFSESGESIVDSSDSEIEDELFEDYMANVEGADETLDSTWLLKNKLQHVAVEDMGCQVYVDEDDDSTSTGISGSDDDSSDSGCASARSATDEEELDQLFDLMEDENFMPDKILNTPGSGKQTRKSIGKSIEPVAWPISTNHTSKKKPISVPGEKKRERKKKIAAKRQERALRRGLDLQAVNSALEDVVLRGYDIYAFAPMEDRDRAQIHKMAAIYRLKSGSQGSGKKRFTVVTRTKRTSLPTGADKYRLASMLDQVDGRTSMSLTGEDHRIAKKIKKAARNAFISLQTPTPKRSGKKQQNLMGGGGFLHKSKSKKGSSGPNSTEIIGGKKLRLPKYANNPMSFISSGTIGNEEESEIVVGTSKCVTTEIETLSRTQRGEASTTRSTTIVKMRVAATIPAAIGTFEAHTKGFGSRMMSKMGFVEGQGLGRDGQGIYNPLEAVKRPKSLGLGAYAPPPPS